MRAGGGRGADLHTHSNRSDGTETPGELIRAAVAAGLDTVALTDHDSTAGWEEARAEAVVTGIGLVPGVELSTRLGWRSIHLLGYLVDPADLRLVAEMDRIREERRSRARRIVDRLGADMRITWDDVLAQTGPGATVGRPHIADALVALGIESDRSAAFAGVLHPRAGYIEPHYAPSPVDGVRIVVAAGGVPVLAHPGTGRRDWMLDDETMAELVDAGLFGLERDHRENTQAGIARIDELVQRYDLGVTGSSDYHGTGKPNRLGEHTTAPAVLAAIRERGTGTASLEPAA